MATIQVKGLDELLRKFGYIPPGVKAAIKAGTEHVMGKAKIYPPSTNANQPKSYQKGAWNTWYERNWGSKWALKDGGWHGHKSSEGLKHRWTMKMENNGLKGVIGNNVTYGKYVQGPDDQADAMKSIGWKTTDEIVDEEKDTVTRFIQSKIDEALRK